LLDYNGDDLLRDRWHVVDADTNETRRGPSEHIYS